MNDNITMSKICEGWACIVIAKAQLCKAAAVRGVFDVASLNDLRDAVDQLGAAFDWLPVDVDE